MHRRHVLDVRRHAWLYCRAGRLVGRSGSKKCWDRAILVSFGLWCFMWIGGKSRFRSSDSLSDSTIIAPITGQRHEHKNIHHHPRIILSLAYLLTSFLKFI